MEKELRRIPSDFRQGTDYAVERRVVSKGKHFLPHWHDYIEFELVLKGCGEQLYNRKRYELRRGSAYLMSYYDFHELHATEEMVLLKIQCNEAMLSAELQKQITQRQGDMCCVLSERDTEYIAQLWERLAEENNQQAPFQDCVAKNLITLVIVTLLRCAPVEIRQELPNMLQMAVAYIHDHFREEIKLTQLAKVCSVTPNYLGVRFYRALGMSVSEYLNDVRLRHACNLLLGTDISVKEIAFASGYNSVEYFLDRFKRKMACTPTAFRKRLRR